MSGTTLVAGIIHEDNLNWVSVGDSRMYIFRDKEFIQLTQDHNYFLELNELFDSGKIDREYYKKEAVSGDALISYIGMGGISRINANKEKFHLEENDTVLICSDGVYKTVTDEKISSIIQSSDSADKISKEIKKEIENKNFNEQDNYSYIVLKKRSR
jgi:protein phosphatase